MSDAEVIKYVHQSGVGQSRQVATIPQVDSRAYAFAYLIRTLADFPADFQVPEAERGFIAGLFLPQESPGVLSQSAYPAQILVLFADAILVAVHPSACRGGYWIAIANLVWLESKRYLLDGGLRLQTRESCHTFGFNARDSAAVDEFLNLVRARAMPAVVQAKATAAMTYGAPLDLKFSHAERTNLEPGEQLVLRFFSPPVQQSRGRLLFHKVEWIAADYVAFTNRRIFWLTDRNGALRELYGATLFESSVRHVSRLAVTRDGDGGRMEIVFAPGLHWQVPVGINWLEDSRRFVEDGNKILAGIHPSMMRNRRVTYVVCRCTPPDRHEVVEEFDDIAVAEFRTYQLDSRLSPEEKRAGVFHYRWIRFELPEPTAEVPSEMK